MLGTMIKCVTRRLTTDNCKQELLVISAGVVADELAERLLEHGMEPLLDLHHIHLHREMRHAWCKVDRWRINI